MRKTSVAEEIAQLRAEAEAALSLLEVTAHSADRDHAERAFAIAQGLYELVYKSAGRLNEPTPEKNELLSMLEKLRGRIQDLTET